MRKINFTKTVASGNDFIITKLQTPNSKLRTLARELCDRKYGIGADGLLVLEKSKIADIRMCIFNADGSEAEMCGNGARCVALYLSRTSHVACRMSKFKIQTKAGNIESEVKGDSVRIRLTDPKGIKWDIPVEVNKRKLKVNFINTGVPHTVIFVEGLEEIDAVNLGRLIRYHRKFAPAGTNVNFVEILDNHSIRVRTYERGVEDETLACGTGAVASSLVAYRLSLIDGSPINVLTRSGEILKVYFERIGGNFKNVWLEGKAKIVYQGEYNV